MVDKRISLFSIKRLRLESISLFDCNAGEKSSHMVKCNITDFVENSLSRTVQVLKIN